MPRSGLALIVTLNNSTLSFCRRGAKNCRNLVPIQLQQQLQFQILLRLSEVFKYGISIKNKSKNYVYSLDFQALTFTKLH